MTEKLLAWFGSQPLKDEVMDRLRKHREADAFTQSIYQRIDPKALGYRGCAIRRTLLPWPTVDDATIPEDPERGWYGEVEHLYGINWMVCSLIDDVFESLPPAECAAFAVDVIDVIPVGADLSILDEWAKDKGRRFWGRSEAPAIAAEFIERLRTAPVPTPA